MDHGLDGNYIPDASWLYFDRKRFDPLKKHEKYINQELPRHHYEYRRFLAGRLLSSLWQFRGYRLFRLESLPHGFLRIPRIQRKSVPSFFLTTDICQHLGYHRFGKYRRESLTSLLPMSWAVMFYWISPRATTAERLRWRRGGGGVGALVEVIPKVQSYLETFWR